MLAFDALVSLSKIYDFVEDAEVFEYYPHTIHLPPTASLHLHNFKDLHHRTTDLDWLCGPE